MDLDNLYSLEDLHNNGNILIPKEIFAFGAIGKRDGSSILVDNWKNTFTRPVNYFVSKPIIYKDLLWNKNEVSPSDGAIAVTTSVFRLMEYISSRDSANHRIVGELILLTPTEMNSFISSVEVERNLLLFILSYYGLLKTKIGSDGKFLTYKITKYYKGKYNNYYVFDIKNVRNILDKMLLLNFKSNNSKI